MAANISSSWMKGRTSSEVHPEMERALPLQHFLMILRRRSGSTMMSGLMGGLGRGVWFDLLGWSCLSFSLSASLSGQRAERRKTCAAFLE